MTTRKITFKDDATMRAVAPELLDFANDLKVWLARAAVSGTYDIPGLQSFRDGARALQLKAQGHA